MSILLLGSAGAGLVAAGWDEDFDASAKLAFAAGLLGVIGALFLLNNAWNTSPDAAVPATPTVTATEADPAIYTVSTTIPDLATPAGPATTFVTTTTAKPPNTARPTTTAGPTTTASPTTTARHSTTAGPATMAVPETTAPALVVPLKADITTLAYCAPQCASAGVRTQPQVNLKVRVRLALRGDTSSLLTVDSRVNGILLLVEYDDPGLWLPGAVGDSQALSEPILVEYNGEPMKGFWANSPDYFEPWDVARTFVTTITPDALAAGGELEGNLVFYLPEGTLQVHGIGVVTGALDGKMPTVIAADNVELHYTDEEF